MMGAPLTINTGQMTADMMSDLSDPSSSENEAFDSSELLSGSVHDDVTNQLAHAGPIGMAAAAAVLSCRKRKHPHHFETNPSRRKRQQTRLLRKLRHTIEEYTTRVGQQAVVLCCTPGKIQSMQMFKVFGSQPLEAVVRNNKQTVLAELDASLAEQTPPSQQENSNLHELPHLVVDGIPTPIDKMTQAQLRNFIPEMLKYSTGRSKPGWGKLECRPVWWPSDLPWANVRSDVRTDEQKKQVAWTDALRQIVKNCYKHHGRDDLLQVFMEEESQGTVVNQQMTYNGATMVQTINNPDGTVSIIQIDAGPNSVVTLPDGTQATVVHAIHDGGGHEQQQQQHVVHSMQDVVQHQDLNGQNVTLAGNEQCQSSIGTLAPLNSGGHIVLAGGDSSLGGIMTMVPVSMYQTVQGLSNFSFAQGIPQNVQIAMSQVQPTMDNTVEMVQRQQVITQGQAKQEIQDGTQAIEIVTVSNS